MYDFQGIVIEWEGKAMAACFHINNILTDVYKWLCCGGWCCRKTCAWI